MTFEVYRDKAGKWRWRLRAGNGEIVAASEAYERRVDCLQTAAMIRDNAHKAIIDEGAVLVVDDPADENVALIDVAEFWRCHLIITDHKNITPGSDEDVRFLALGLAGEAGEVANDVKKIWRDGKTPERVEHLKTEIGDTLAYLVLLARAVGLNLTDAARDNRLKIYERWPATRSSAPFEPTEDDFSSS